MPSNAITVRRSFHRIWIAGKKSLVKRAPEQAVEKYLSSWWFEAPMLRHGNLTNHMRDNQRETTKLGSITSSMQVFFVGVALYMHAVALDCTGHDCAEAS